MHRIEAYVRLALIFIVISTILYLPVLFFLKKRGRSIPRQISYLGLFCSSFLIIFATILFTPITFHPETHTLNIIPFAWVGTVDDFNQFVVEKIPNVLLFIPLGFFLPIVFPRLRNVFKTTVFCFFVTFSVELIQFFIGRSSDIDDIITNLLGSIIGYLVFKQFHRIFHNRKCWKMLIKCE